MKIRRFLDTVPSAVRVSALLLVIFATLAGLVVGSLWRSINNLPYAPGATISELAIGFSAGLFLGSLLAIWLLCLGYVYADARRRAMRPVLWVLVAALFPHLLGFLLYFVLRQPLASTCPHCTQPVPFHQPFCSWCGTPQPPTPQAQTSSAGLDSLPAA